MPMSRLAALPRTLWRALATAAVLLGGAAIVATTFGWVSPATRLAIRRRWSRALLGALGVAREVRWHGEPPDRRHGLVVANHISFVDIFAIDAVASADFVSKDDVQHWPLVGAMARRSGTVFIERGSRRAAHRTQETMIERLHAGHRVAIFPEGTTTPGDDLLPFHGALFQAAVEAGAPVHPVVVRYRDALGSPSRAAAYVGDTTLAQCVATILGARGLVVELEWLPAIAPPHADRRHLAHHAHQLIAHAVRRAANTGV